MRLSLAAPILASLIMLAACTGTAATGDAPAPGGTSATADQPQVSASGSRSASTPDAAHGATPASASPTGIPGRTKPAPPMSTPLPPERVETQNAAPPTACRTSADCAVKDVGSCCGAMPACVSKGAAVNPAAVKAECARKGMVSTCGFKEIQSCSCIAGRCQDAGGDATPVAQ